MGDRGGGESVNHLTTYKFCRHSCVRVNFTTELIAMKVVSTPRDRTGGGGGGDLEGGGVYLEGGGVSSVSHLKFCRHNCVLVNFTTEMIAMKVVSSLKDRTGGVVGHGVGGGESVNHQ